MAEQIVKAMPISSCKDCLFVDVLSRAGKPGVVLMCGKTESIIPHKSGSPPVPPGWCPLPNYPGEKES